MRYQVVLKIKFRLNPWVIWVSFSSSVSWQDKTQHSCLVSAIHHSKGLEGWTSWGEYAGNGGWFKLMSWWVCYSSFGKGGWLKNCGFHAQLYAILPFECVCVMQALGTNGVFVMTLQNIVLCYLSASWFFCGHGVLCCIHIQYII